MNVKLNPPGDFDVPASEQPSPTPTPEALPNDPAFAQAAVERYAEIYASVMDIEATYGLAA